MEPSTIQEVGDTACKALISGGALLLIGFVVLWIVYFVKGNPREDIQIPWKIKE